MTIAISKAQQMEEAGVAGMAGTLAIELAGEQVLLLPEKALYWPREKMLIIADIHFGNNSTCSPASSMARVPAMPATPASSICCALLIAIVMVRPPFQVRAPAWRRDPTVFRY